jgi:hypothetical protein
VTKKQQRDQDLKETTTQLRKWCRPGTRVYTTVTHVAASGMSRRIRVFVIRKNEPKEISGWVGHLLGCKRHNDGGLVIHGCGMDMGYHIVMQMSYALHGRDSVGAEARAAAEQGRFFQPRPGNYRSGYSLIHNWL